MIKIKEASSIFALHLQCFVYFVHPIRRRRGQTAQFSQILYKDPRTKLSRQEFQGQPKQQQYQKIERLQQ